MADFDDESAGFDRRRLLRRGTTMLVGAAPFSGRDGLGIDRPPLPLPSVVNVVTDFGARGDGRTDDTRAFETAYRCATSRIEEGVGRTVIDIPPGNFLVKTPNALMNGTDPERRANGLRFRGAGKRMTTITFQPEAGPGSYLCRNEDMWANVSFEKMQFRSATPGASFFYSYSTGQAQDYRFRECEWMGEWEYGLALDGTDTNSEMRWEACRVGGSYRRAFLYSGLSQRSRQPKSQDQFLNYWFHDMKVEYEWGNFLEFPYGGSITCQGGSYIITGRRPTDSTEHGRNSMFFCFPVGQHHDSVQRFHAQDIRFEVRDPDVLVIDCAWQGGTVSFDNCDDTALAFKNFSSEVRPHRYAIGPRGPLIRYDSCQLVGRHEYRPSRPAESIPRTVRYDMCLLRSHRQSDFVVAQNLDRTPFVTFVDCLDNPAAPTRPTPSPAAAPTPPGPAPGAATDRPVGPTP
ncbi:glycosyl hydrolase family 28-related protein [Streptomyces sp. NPDC048191]|uniref:glycosyl hydrolase family 28-related protein n=1 Tax=Streptomyces sp. NPDC048191 TaxID=3155484 RepID=UPI0034095F62